MPQTDSSRFEPEALGVQVMAEGSLFQEMALRLTTQEHTTRLETAICTKLEYLYLWLHNHASVFV